MNVASRLALALTAPVSVMVFYACSVYLIPWRPSGFVVFLVAGVPTFFGALLFAFAPWRPLVKVAVVIVYLGGMLWLLMLVGLFLACAFGDCI